MRLFIGSEELRETDDEIFITFGRALYVAQDFEENCRFLASSLGVFEQLKSGVLSASEEELK